MRSRTQSDRRPVVWPINVVPQETVNECTFCALVRNTNDLDVNTLCNCTAKHGLLITSDNYRCIITVTLSLSQLDLKGNQTYNRFLTAFISLCLTSCLSIILFMNRLEYPFCTETMRRKRSAFSIVSSAHIFLSLSFLTTQSFENGCTVYSTFLFYKLTTTDNRQLLYTSK